MPVIVYQPSGTTTIAGTRGGPESHLCLSIFVLFINPPFGIFSLIFSLWAKHVASYDWNGAVRWGKVSWGISVTGIVIFITAAVILVLVFFSRDS